MAKGFYIKVKGLKEVIDELKDDVSGKKEIIDGILEFGSQAIAAEAKQKVPVDTGRLKGSITSSKEANFQYKIVAQANYAAYVEFGTGNLFTLLPEQEWNDIAAQFKGKGVREVNFPTRPFLRPAVLRQTPIILQDIKDILEADERL
jgi:HK97 gp10 family phage protein